jgi:hypothetical protein
VRLSTACQAPSPRGSAWASVKAAASNSSPLLIRRKATPPIDHWHEKTIGSTVKSGDAYFAQVLEVPQYERDEVEAPPGPASITGVGW